MRPLHVLIVEDSDDDFALVQHHLERHGFALTSQRVDTRESLERALAEHDWEIIISDFSMPQFDALDALRIVQASRQPDVPFVIVSGSVGEESVAAALKAGVANYVMKSNFAGVVPVIERELKDAQTRKERREAFAALEQAVSARDDFLSVASHELKTPLSALRLQAQGLSRLAKQREGVLLSDAQILCRLAMIEASAERLTLLIERLLEISRVTSGRLELSREDVDLVQLVDERVAAMRAELADAWCQLSIAAPPCIIGQWDRDRIATVIDNLLANAAKYGARKPIRIAIEDSDNAARLQITDEGIGISSEDQTRIFGRFERAVPEKHYGGFGVGLWLTRQIVEAHGGSIDVCSKPSKGSTFTVTLPKGQS